MAILKTAARALLGSLGGALLATAAAAQAPQCELEAHDRDRFEAEHLVGGQPTPGPILVRRAYVAQYDETHRVPRWVSWRVVQDYRSSVPRQGAWASFRWDPEVANPVRDADYLGIYDNGRGFARGHLAPFFISGGDRNGDGEKATKDYFDACTVFEINFMSNIAPQLHNRFNGSRGLWYRLETIERRRLMPAGRPFHVIAGTLFGPDPERVGPQGDIGVPDMFYRILVTESGVVPFLFVHRRRLDDAGCELDAQLEDCIVTLADIERLTGAEFFRAWEASERPPESSDARAIWRELVR
jgi:endonuclease G, mitochondrial